jgi:hypothetical protein
LFIEFICILGRLEKSNRIGFVLNDLDLGHNFESVGLVDRVPRLRNPVDVGYLLVLKQNLLVVFVQNKNCARQKVNYLEGFFLLTLGNALKQKESSLLESD